MRDILVCECSEIISIEQWSSAFQSRRTFVTKRSGVPQGGIGHQSLVLREAEGFVITFSLREFFQCIE